MAVPSASEHHTPAPIPLTTKISSSLSSAITAAIPAGVGAMILGPILPPVLKITMYAAGGSALAAATTTGAIFFNSYGKGKTRQESKDAAIHSVKAGVQSGKKAWKAARSAASADQRTQKLNELFQKTIDGAKWLKDEAITTGSGMLRLSEDFGANRRAIALGVAMGAVTLVATSMTDSLADYNNLTTVMNVAGAAAGLSHLAIQN